MIAPFDPIAAGALVVRTTDLDRGLRTLPPADGLDLSGTVVAVTGAARGIGRAIAHALAAAGAVVGMLDVDRAGLNEGTQGEGHLEACIVDIADPVEGPAALEELARKHGRLDALMNNAGVVHADPFLEVSYETWRRVMRVNGDGTFLMSQAAGRLMKSQQIDARSGRRGLIVNVSSMAAEVGRPTLCAYGASKATINHLSKSAALALEAFQVPVTVVYPGNIREGMWGRLGEMIAQAEGRDPGSVEGARTFQSADEFAGIIRDVVGYPGVDLNGALVVWDRRVLPL
jgi:NAD(P)-dependent dehydrogenase (short-subunit alcohol dehydrogenase family)